MSDLSLDTDQRDRKRRSLRPLSRLVPFVTAYPRRLVLTLLFLLVAAITSLTIPMLAGSIIDQGFLTRNLGVVSSYGWAIIGIAAIMAVASGARFYFVSVLGERVLTDLRRAVFDHLLTLDATFFDSNRVGELTSRLIGDVATIRGAIGSSLSVAMRNTVVMVGAVILMFITNPLLTVAVVVVGPLLILPVILYARRLQGMSRRTQDRLADISAMATETLGATRTIKSFGQEGAQAELYAVRSEASYDAEVRRLRFRAMLIVVIMFLATSAVVVLFWWGTKSVFDGATTAGQLAQFLIYTLMASNSLAALSEIWGTLQTVSGATERLMEILATKPHVTEPTDPQPLPMPTRGTVAFESVDFTYHTREGERVLHGLSFAVKRGETVALVGPSGAGKTTVLSLLQRFYDVTGGRVLVDGVDVRQVKLAELRKRFAYVEQEPMIFAGTVADNIRFGKPDATDAEVEAAARAALVHEFVTALPDGYNSVVGERGVMLSGGQKQRIAIARALIKDAPILLLDEATSALDAQSEHLVQLALERLMEGRTTLVIAHRLATIRDADRILVFEGGRLIDQGTHDELVAKGGRYAELARLQFRLSVGDMSEAVEPAAE